MQQYTFEMEKDVHSREVSLICGSLCKEVHAHYTHVILNKETSLSLASAKTCVPISMFNLHIALQCGEVADKLGLVFWHSVLKSLHYFVYHVIVRTYANQNITSTRKIQLRTFASIRDHNYLPFLPH